MCHKVTKHLSFVNEHPNSLIDPTVSRRKGIFRKLIILFGAILLRTLIFKGDTSFKFCVSLGCEPVTNRYKTVFVQGIIYNGVSEFAEIADCLFLAAGE